MPKLLDGLLDQFVQERFAIVLLISYPKVVATDAFVKSKEWWLSLLVGRHYHYFIAMLYEPVGLVGQYSFHTARVPGACYAIEDFHAFL